MAETLDITCTQVFSLEECIEQLRAMKQPDIAPGRGLLEAAQYLKMLGNNKEFLVDLVNEELASLEEFDRFQANNGFSQQIIDLGGTSDFWLRANIWPPSKNSQPADWEKGLFAYDMPHDHTSDFLTVGYWGPGYETDIYEYDPDSVIGYSGESVDLTFLERTRLTQGKVMYYRANRDVHTQIIPRQFSISINLLLVSQEKGFGRNQYWFDLKSGTIESTISRSGLTSFVFLCRLAAFLGNEKSVEHLVRIASQHANPHIRVEAYEAIAKLQPSDAQVIWGRALKDHHQYVQHCAQQRFSNGFLLDHTN